VCKEVTKSQLAEKAIFRLAIEITEFRKFPKFRQAGRIAFGGFAESGQEEGI
jgi:hypothetical protein